MCLSVPFSLTLHLLISLSLSPCVSLYICLSLYFFLGSMAFLTLREGVETVQCVFGGGVSKDLLKWLAAVPSESLVDVLGSIVSPETPVTSTTQKSEIQGEKVFCIVKAKRDLPFQLKDAMQPEDSEREARPYPLLFLSLLPLLLFLLGTGGRCPAAGQHLQ